MVIPTARILAIVNALIDNDVETAQAILLAFDDDEFGAFCLVVSAMEKLAAARLDALES